MSEHKTNNYDQELAKQTAQATLVFLSQLRENLGTTDQEATFILRQNIDIIEKNLTLPGVRDYLSEDQQVQIEQALKNAKVKLKYIKS